MEVNLEFFQKAYRNPKEDVSQNYTGSSLPKKKAHKSTFFIRWRNLPAPVGATVG